MATTANEFNAFSLLRLNELGQFLDDTKGRPPYLAVSDIGLASYFKNNVVIPNNVTDVFVWVHGWQNNEEIAVRTARHVFFGLDQRIHHNAAMYPHLAKFVPAYIAVHWPSMSTPGPLGYSRIRKRAKEMTTKGTAEFLLASLLGYLNAQNHRDDNRKVLRAKQGYFVHCLGHSFGGRFLTAAIQAAARPTEQMYKVLGPARRETKDQFTVDSLCVLQMAAPASSFYSEFMELLNEAPLSGPIVLTYSGHDHALCVWHAIGEFEVGIGCNGATSPSTHIGSITMNDPATAYPSNAFVKDITNVNASGVFKNRAAIVGAHSDIMHPETFHLIASIVDQLHATA